MTREVAPKRPASLLEPPLSVLKLRGEDGQEPASISGASITRPREIVGPGASRVLRLLPHNAVTVTVVAFS